jgi:PAS domain S-box-containing protein
MSAPGALTVIYQPLPAQTTTAPSTGPKTLTIRAQSTKLRHKQHSAISGQAEQDVSTDTAQDQQDEIDRLQAVLDAKNAELEALRARLGAENADLRHRLEQFRTIFDNAASGITIQDSEGVITAANQTFMDMVGYDRDELLGLPATAVTHPDFVQHTRALVESARRGGPARFHYEKKLLRKDGSTLWPT